MHQGKALEEMVALMHSLSPPAQGTTSPLQQAKLPWEKPTPDPVMEAVRWDKS